MFYYWRQRYTCLLCWLCYIRERDICVWAKTLDVIGEVL